MSLTGVRSLRTVTHTCTCTVPCTPVNLYTCKELGNFQNRTQHRSVLSTLKYRFPLYPTSMVPLSPLPGVSGNDPKNRVCLSPFR